jgi:hypothetical protein
LIFFFRGLTIEFPESGVPEEENKERMKMNRDDIHHAVLEFIQLMEIGRSSKEENLQALEFALDNLALVHNFVEYQYDDSEYPEAIRKDYKELRRLAEERFPDLGIYNSPDSITQKINKSEICVGVAIDDVADIAGDMYEIAWYWNNTSPENALWHFHFGYDTHWGFHLRNLQLYVFAKKLGQ